jgi:hypothetical protein
MPDIGRVTTLAGEIVQQRIAAYQKTMADQAAATTGGDAAQRERKAAYQAVRASQPQDYPAARAAFDASYGPEEWQKQQRLGLRRDEKAGI